jgi:hypothetical protein
MSSRLGDRVKWWYEEYQVAFSPFAFPAAVISCAVRWYHRFNLSLGDIEELLLERGVSVTYKSIRNWCERFGAQFARCPSTAGSLLSWSTHSQRKTGLLHRQPWCMSLHPRQSPLANAPASQHR